MRIPSGCSILSRDEIVDRVKGLIFGTVLGDSLGLATEGMTRKQVERSYGQGPIQFGLDDEMGNSTPFARDAYRSQFEENDFSGDVEQLMLVIRSLVDNDGQFNTLAFAKSLKEYSLHGIRGLNQPPMGMDPVEQVAIFHPQFLSCPKLAATEAWQASEPMRGAKSVIIRSLVLGAAKFWNGTVVVENTAQCCRLTHPDPRYLITCIILATLVARIMRGQDKEMDPSAPQALSAGKSDTSGQTQQTTSPLLFTDTLPSNPDAIQLVRSAIDIHKRILTEPNTDPLFHTPETNPERFQLYYQQLTDGCYAIPTSLSALQLHEMDQSQMAFKCLSTGLYAFTRTIPVGRETECFKKIMMDVIMQGGDADANAAVTGALLGARIGYSRLPSEWVIGLKRWEWLEDRVDEFCHQL